MKSITCNSVPVMREELKSIVPNLMWSMIEFVHASKQDNT